VPTCADLTFAQIGASQPICLVSPGHETMTFHSLR